MLPLDPKSRATPTYDLERIQQLVGQGPITFRFTTAALHGAAALDLSENDIVEAVLSLTSSCFYKSMESERLPGLWQDVYHLTYRGVVLYLKVQIDQSGRAVVVQCKEK
ncbi:MAG TPA: type II toxin-antitoxin system MqsR family toxin [Longimicrobium sp.]|jgi:motility quorum-sensing regulator/GCU-specific mRNA interferase toxin